MPDQQEAPRSAQVLVDRIIKDPHLVSSLKADPEKTLTELKERVLQEHPVALPYGERIYGKVVTYLGLIGILAVASWAGTFVIAILSYLLMAQPLDVSGLQAFLVAVEIPSGIVALGSAAVGALAGLLAPTPTRQQ